MKIWAILALLIGLWLFGLAAWAEAIPQKLSQLIELAQHTAAKDLRSAIDYAEQALKIAHAVNASSTKQAEIHSLLGEYHNRYGEYEQSLNHYKIALDLLQQISTSNTNSVGQTKLNICIANWRLGVLDNALQSCLEALRIFDKNNDQQGYANALHNIGIVYDYLGNYDLALENHHRALEIRTKLNDKKGIADSLNSIGIIHNLTKHYQKALEFYRQSLSLRKTFGDSQGIAQSLNNVGVVLRILKEYSQSLEYLYESLKVREQAGDKYEAANTLNNIGEVYIELKNYKKAEEVLRKGLKLAKEADAKEIMRENYEFLSILYEKNGEYERALEYFKQSSDLRKQIFDKELSKKIAEQNAKYESEKRKKEIELLKKENNIKELELDKQKLHQNFLIAGFIFVFVLLFFSYSRYNIKKKAHEAISLEKEKADRLLRNILPVRVAADLKETGKTQPESFDNVTVYFSDIAGFTNISSTLEPKVLISELNELFTAFDNIIERNHCERVKTIGDAYLCVCGMPEENLNHAFNMVKSATEILDYLRERNNTHYLQWHIRIGIHTGKVVGGVVGVKKYIYDVFGDTINTASRMETHSAPMRINLSETTYELVKDQFPCIARGLVPVKGKGEMKMFFLISKLGNHYSITDSGIPLFSEHVCSNDALIQQKHYDKIAKEYLENLSYPHTEEYSHYLDDVFNQLFIDNKFNYVAEICCGGGEAIRIMGHKISHGIGIDISLSMLEKSRNSFLDEKYLFIQGDATDLPLQDEKFDTVIIIGGIHHVNDRKKLFSEVYRVLKPTGTFYFREPVSDFFLWKWLRDIIYKISPNLDADTEKPLRYKETVPILEEVGFQLTEWKTYGHLGYCLFMNSDVLIFNKLFRFIPGIRQITRWMTKLDHLTVSIPGLKYSGLIVIGSAKK